MKWNEPIFEFRQYGVKGSLRAVVPKVLPEFSVKLPGENTAPVEVSPGDFLIVDVFGNVTVQRKAVKKKKRLFRKKEKVDASKSDKNEGREIQGGDTKRSKSEGNDKKEREGAEKAS